MRLNVLAVHMANSVKNCTGWRRAPFIEGIVPFRLTFWRAHKQMFPHIAQKIWQRFMVFSTIVVITVCLFLVANGVARLLSKQFSPAQAEIEARIQHHEVRTWVQNWGENKLLRAYPGKTVAQIVSILGDQTGNNPVYHPFFQFKMPAISTATFNYHEAGFRINPVDQGSWPPQSDSINVFIFGGSTTMGGGVPDDETWPFFLQDELRRRYPGKRIYVYNFGQRAFISSQEKEYFQFLLLHDIKPHMVIFLDGLNDNILWDGVPAWTPWLEKAATILQDLWTKDSIWFHLRLALEKTPLADLARSVTKKGASPFPKAESLNASSTQHNDAARFDGVLARYERNMKASKAVGDAFGVGTLFVWQPIPYYQYPLANEVRDYLAVMGPNHASVLRAMNGYQRELGTLMNHSIVNRNFISCADIQKDTNEMLYVDHAHYNAHGNQLVAACVARAIEDKRLIPSSAQ